MTISKRHLQLWLIIFLPFVFCYLFYTFKSDKETIEEIRKPVTDHIGEQFQITNLLDTLGNEVNLDFSKSELTIVDFWFDKCPPCIEDMHQFTKLLKGKEGELSIVSVSINSFKVWRNLFIKPYNTQSSFLLEPPSNWTHLVLKSNEDPKLKNAIPGDNLNLLLSYFNSSSFPLYAVVDKNGIIKDMPGSAAEYLKIEVEHKNEFFIYLAKIAALKSFPFLLISAFVIYSGCFWILSIITLTVREIHRRKYSS